MSRFSKFANKTESTIKKYSHSAVQNYMAGISYEPNPLQQLKMVMASSIFGEPSYYKNETENSKHTIQLIIKSLDYDYTNTVKLIGSLRKEYGMRLNPSLLFVMAVLHDKRKEFDNVVLLKEMANELIQIPTDILNQFELYMYLNGSKNNLPNFIKRIWTRYFVQLDRYRVGKYKKDIIDTIRLSNTRKIRLKNQYINELLETSNIVVEDTEQTWQKLKSSGKSWLEILDTIKLPHMALLMNLRGIITENIPTERLNDLMTKLIEGVPYGKLWPYKYYTAYREISKDCDNRIVLDGLENCIDKSIDNFPKLKGKTISLVDNSGSAWGAIPSEYGSVTVAEIGNLSGIITALNSDIGEVGIFGDKLEIVSISKRNGILSQHTEINKKGQKIGGGTENGIWLFFKKAIEERLHYDNIFIYSDMQAGHGGLFGIDPKEYKKYVINDRYVDVLKLVLEYRKINPNVNVFCIQTAGYNNNVLPENLQRCALITGWTGKETLYAKTMIDIWNQQ